MTALESRGDIEIFESNLQLKIHRKEQILWIKTSTTYTVSQLLPVKTVDNWIKNMPSNESSSRRTSVIQAPETLQLRKVSLGVPESRYNRRLSTSSQASTIFGRRKSYAMPRFGNPSAESAHHVPKYLNSYKTEPNENKRFRTKAVTDIIESVFQEKLSDLEYSADHCKRMVAPITEEIKAEVKLLGFDRFKIVCVVHIGSLNNQDVRVASRCLWDDSFDRVASSSFCNETLFASASVFGVYRE